MARATSQPKNRFEDYPFCEESKGQDEEEPPSAAENNSQAQHLLENLRY